MGKSALAFRLLCFTFVALLALLPRTVHTQQTSIPLPREERIRVFDQVWRAVYDNYYDKNFRGVDWRQQKEVFRSQAESAATNTELYRVLRQMLGKLGDAHTRIYSPEDGFDRYRPSGVTIGLVVRRIEGQPVVTWVDPNSDIVKHGIYPGQIVLKVDGQSVDTVLQKVRKEIGESSTSIALDLQSLDRLFYGPKDQPVSVTFADQDGRQKTVMLARRHTEFQRRVSARQLPYKLGYIEVTGFGPEIERDFDMAMQQMQGTRGLILDLRNNGGGFVTTVSQIASYFFAEETDLGEFITRYGRSTHRRTQKLRNVYREPLIVLVSSRSASGSEIFAAAMQERKRALILGTNPATCGCLLGVSRTLKLSDGGKLNISDTDYRTALGRRVEGVGVKPDRQVEVRIADLTAGRDRSLEIAVDMLGRTIAFGSRDTLLDFKLRIPDFGLRSPGRTQPASQLQK